MRGLGRRAIVGLALPALAAARTESLGGGSSPCLFVQSELHNIAQRRPVVFLEHKPGCIEFEGSSRRRLALGPTMVGRKRETVNTGMRRAEEWRKRGEQRWHVSTGWLVCFDWWCRSHGQALREPCSSLTCLKSGRKIIQTTLTMTSWNFGSTVFQTSCPRNCCNNTQA